MVNNPDYIQPKTKKQQDTEQLIEDFDTLNKQIGKDILIVTFLAMIIVYIGICLPRMRSNQTETVRNQIYDLEILKVRFHQLSRQYREFVRRSRVGNQNQMRLFQDSVLRDLEKALSEKESQEGWIADPRELLARIDRSMTILSELDRKYWRYYADVSSGKEIDGMLAPTNIPEADPSECIPNLILMEEAIALLKSINTNDDFKLRVVAEQYANRKGTSHCPFQDTLLNSFEPFRSVLSMHTEPGPGRSVDRLNSKGLDDIMDSLNPPVKFSILDDFVKLVEFAEKQLQHLRATEKSLDLKIVSLKIPERWLIILTPILYVILSHQITIASVKRLSLVRSMTESLKRSISQRVTHIAPIPSRIPFAGDTKVSLKSIRWLVCVAFYVPFVILFAIFWLQPFVVAFAYWSYKVSNRWIDMLYVLSLFIIILSHWGQIWKSTAAVKAKLTIGDNNEFETTV